MGKGSHHPKSQDASAYVDANWENPRNLSLNSTTPGPLNSARPSGRQKLTDILRHTSALLMLFFVSCKLPFLLPVYMLLFFVNFAIADVLGKCGMNLNELLLCQDGRMKIHPTRNRSPCVAWQILTAMAVRTDEKKSRKEDTHLDKEIPSTNVGSY